MSEGPEPGKSRPTPRSTAEIAKRRGFKLRGRTVREHVARGVILNGSFMVGLNGLSFIKGFVVAAFLTREDYGVWGIITVSLITLLWLKQVGVGDKYIQQDEDDQEIAFQKAFTVEIVFTSAFVLLYLAVLPLIVLAYGEDELLAPGLAIALTLPAGILAMPIWTYSRRMDFLRARIYQSIDPVVSFAVAVGLAIAGFGYWSLIAGIIAGAWAMGIAGVLASPYKLKLRFDRSALHSYSSFSWPLFVSSLATMTVAQVAMFVTDAKLGLAAAGVLTLALNITQFTERLDAVVTGTLYPAVAALRENRKLLYESFIKSNRLALMWAIPFGVGLSLFASDLVHFVIGDEWTPAIVVLEAFGLLAAVHHVGFNYTAYFRAVGWTRPLAVIGVIASSSFLVSILPLISEWELRGLVVAVGIQGFVHLALRVYFLKRLFVGFSFLRHALRALAPTVPAAAAVLLVRLVESGTRSGSMAAAELAVYIAVTVLATVTLERSLLREVRDYLRSRSAVGAPA